jgi:hypothetical protein
LKNKEVVFGLRQRKGPIKLVQVADNKAGTLYDQVNKHVEPNADRIMTDDAGGYNFQMTKFRNIPHSKIRHSVGEYVRGEVHTNTIESGFSLFKRAIVGSFHHVSIKHLQRYLDEFNYRFNRREIVDLFEQTVARMAGIGAMPYSKLVEQNAFTPFVRP